MGSQKLQRIKRYTVDLRKTKGEGDVKCPKCGVVISPDDETEEVYTILDTVMDGDRLDRIVLQCFKCLSRIDLTGFDFLSRQ